MAYYVLFNANLILRPQYLHVNIFLQEHSMEIQVHFPIIKNWQTNHCLLFRYDDGAGRFQIS